MEYWSDRRNYSSHSNTPLLHSSVSQTHRFSILSVNPAEHFADFTDSGFRPYRFHDRRHEIAVCLGNPRKLAEHGSHFLCVATFLSLLKSLNLFFLDFSLTLRIEIRALFRLCESVHADDDSLPVIHLFLICDRGAVDFALRKAALDGFGSCLPFHPACRSKPLLRVPSGWSTTPDSRSRPMDRRCSPRPIRGR